MALEDIARRISSDANKESSKIERKAKTEAREILAEAKRTAANKRKKIVKIAEADAEKEKKRVLALAKLEARNIVLKQKQRAFERAFDAALDRLLKLSETQYLVFMKDMLSRVVTEGNEEVIVASNDRERMGKMLKEVNQGRSQSGKKGEMRLSDETRDDIKGGFVLRSGKIEENNSLSSLLHSMKEELEPQLFDILLSAKKKKTKPKGV